MLRILYCMSTNTPALSSRTSSGWLLLFWSAADIAFWWLALDLDQPIPSQNQDYNPFHPYRCFPCYYLIHTIMIPSQADSLLYSCSIILLKSNTGRICYFWYQNNSTFLMISPQCFQSHTNPLHLEDQMLIKYSVQQVSERSSK